MQNTESVSLLEYEGPHNELLKNLASDNGRWWLGCLKRFLRKEDPWDIRYWDAWRTITYGYLTTAKHLKKLCSTQGNTMCAEGYKVLKTLETTKEYKTADLQIATLEQLGLQAYASLQEVNAKIVELGFYLLPLELVFNLHYQFQNRKHTLFAAMNPIANPQGREFVFLFGKGDRTSELWVAYNMTAMRSAKTQVVFVKRFN